MQKFSVPVSSAKQTLQKLDDLTEIKPAWYILNYALLMEVLGSTSLQFECALNF
jgi:hypothetical protein